MKNNFDENNKLLLLKDNIILYKSFFIIKLLRLMIIDILSVIILQFCF